MKVKKIGVLQYILLKNKLFPFIFISRFKKKVPYFFFEMFSRNLSLLFTLKSLSYLLTKKLNFTHVNSSPNFSKLFSKTSSSKKWKAGSLTNCVDKRNKVFSAFAFYNNSLSNVVGIREAKKLRLFYVSFQPQAPLNMKKQKNYTLFYNAKHLRAIWFSNKIIAAIFE